MTREQASELLKRFTYKPNFRFIFPDERIGERLSIEMKVPKVDNPDRSGWITYPMDFFWLETPGQFFNILFNHIISMEMHEAKEWFQIDGKPLFEPHPTVEE